MKKLLKIVLVSSLALLYYTCYYDEFPEEPEVVIDPDEIVSFADDIIPIFISFDCAQCHNPAQQDPDLTQGNEYSSLVPNYVSAGNALSSQLYIKLAVDEHRNVDATSLALIKEWIDRGAENN